MYPALTRGRILPIDALRGITILVMIFVNELAGVSGIPAWMKHMPADADAMTFVDMVFPSFLFIVGMSVPFALNSRLAKGSSFWQLQWHIGWRTLGLLVLGVFMVNAEEGSSMQMPLYLWSLLFYISAILVWNVYTFDNKRYAMLLKGLGIAGLITLAAIYRGPDGGYMRPHWWGILGLIGWAYLYACICYQLVKGSVAGIAILIAASIAFYIIAQNTQWNWMTAQSGNAIHTGIVLCGILLTLLFFSEDDKGDVRKKYLKATGFFIVLAFVAGFLRPLYKISKIHATPSWALGSAACCVLIFALLYWLITIKNYSRWTGFFRPAAANPLLTYILPGIIYVLMQLCHVRLPGILHEGVTGIVWSMAFAIAVMWLVHGLNKLHIRLQL